jgi:CRP-like cAMP-binding protein
MNTKEIGGRVLYYEDGDLIFQENSLSDEMYMIESGKVEISRLIEHKKTVISVLGKGDFFGEMAMLDDMPRYMSATSIGKTTLISLTTEEIINLMQTNIRFTITFMQSMANRLRDTIASLDNLISKFYEFSDGFVRNLTPDNQYLKIGEMLVEMEYMTPVQLDRLLQKQKEMHMLERKHKLIGEMIVESGMITDKQLHEALTEQRLRLRRSLD